MLTHLCSTLKCNVALVHCNFSLRAEESDGDEAFVLEFAENLGLEVFIERFDTNAYANENKLSIQLAARELRYDWFAELAAQLQFDYILTGHHADDNLETFLINLTRGTGLEGLTGIPEVNTNIVRPLLPFSREIIENYAKANKLQWREDSSNASTKYLRNKLRHDVIPLLKEINPQLLQNFNKTQAYLKDSKSIIDDRIEIVSNQIITTDNQDYISLSIAEIKKLNNPKAYLFAILKSFNFTEWDDVVHLLEAQSGKQIVSRTHRLIKDRDCLLLSEIAIQESNDITVLNADKEIKTPLGILVFDEADAVFKNKSNTIYVDMALLEYPLTLRKWQEGDVFYPFGMKGKKKLSKYFKDEKLSLLDKENVWLLCSKNVIVWILNRRADNRFRVTERTKEILKITLE